MINYDEKGRVCSKCEVYKSWDNFSSAPRGPNLKRSACKKCRSSDPKQRVWAKTWRGKNTNKIKTMKDTDDPLRLKAKGVRNGMKRGSKETIPTTSDIYKWLSSITEWVCYYTSEKLDVRNFSVDHKIPLYRGGTNEITNLCICSKEVNSLKGIFTDTEFFEFLALIENCSSDLREILIKRLVNFQR